MSSGVNRNLKAERSVSPLLWLNRILGLTIFEYPVGNSWPKLSTLYVMLIAVLYSILFCYGDLMVVRKNRRLPVVSLVFKVIKYINIGVAGVSSILGLSYYKQLTECMERVTMIDETLEIFGINPDYANGRKGTILIISIWSLGAIVTIIINSIMGYFLYNTLYDALVRVFIFLIPLLLNSLIELSFAVIVSFLGKRFERINALIHNFSSIPWKFKNSEHLDKYQVILKNYVTDDQTKLDYYNKNRSNIEFILTTARQLHLNLCVVSRDVNKIYSKQVTMKMGSNFVLMTGFSYCIYIYVNDPTLNFFAKLRQFESIFLWMLLNVTVMIYIVQASVTVSAEAQKTSHVAHEIQMSQPETKVTREINQLSLQITQNPLHFTGCGLFTLNYDFVQGFIGSVIVYVMILIQNQSAEIKKNLELLANYTLDTLNTSYVMITNNTSD